LGVEVRGSSKFDIRNPKLELIGFGFSSGDGL
jgi:hypothetical protein